MVALLKMAQMGSEEGAAERRMFDRAPADGQAMGHRVDHTLSARQNPRLTLELRDLSLGGMAAVADFPLERGEHLSVVFPRRGLAPAWNALGRVVRCEETPFGYCVGIEFEPLLAA
jgi:PilZ domain-containing protein